MSKLVKRKRLEYCVATGRPSWHQQRAGASYDGLMCFNRRIEAKRYLSRVKRLRPDEPATLLYPRPRSKR